MGPGFVETLDVGRFHGVGPATREKMRRLGIETGGDLRARPLEELQKHFGKAGAYFHAIARGVDMRPVRVDRPRRSLGAETTFAVDLQDAAAACAAIAPIVEKVWGLARNAGLRARSVTVKIKYDDFHLITRARTLPRAFESPEDLQANVFGLLAPAFPTPKGVRLLGVSLSAFEEGKTEPDAQLALSL
jgi:DNA polymerase-4